MSNTLLDSVKFRNHLLGLLVQPNPFLGRTPKLKLSHNPKLHLSEEFRAEFDAWLLETFGTSKEEQAVMYGDTLFVSPAAYDRLRREGAVR